MNNTCDDGGGDVGGLRKGDGPVVKRSLLYVCLHALSMSASVYAYVRACPQHSPQCRVHLYLSSDHPFPRACV